MNWAEGMWLIFLIVFVCSGGWVLEKVLRFQTEHRMWSNNFVGRKIPYAGGTFLWLMCLFFAAGSSLLEQGGRDTFTVPAPALAFFVLLISIVYVAGLIDDVIGHAEIKGLRGHFRAWLKKGLVTTGLVKAMLTSLAALWAVSLYGGNVFSKALGFLMLTLSANAVNLLDVRPGRALKGSLFLIVLVLVGGADQTVVFYLFPILAGMLWFLPDDVQGRAMLGDSGSNVIGFSVGFCAMLSLTMTAQTVLAGMLVLLHVWAEKNSLSELIDRWAVLRWLDRLGRLQ